MKISKLTLVLFLLVVIAICSISHAKKHKKFNSEKPKKKEIKPQRNSLGFEVKADTVVSNFPFKVERCDQIVMFKGKLIPDHDDYTKRRDVLFTITAYHLNAFSEKNPDKLLQSILFTRGKTLPQPVKGARGCIYIDGGKAVHPMILCGEDEKIGNSILNSVNKFAGCRGGQQDQKAEIDFPKLKKLLKSCGLNGGFKDPKKLKQKIEELKKKFKNKKDHLKNAVGFFHPGFNGVPGTNN
jgi:hypothetical protein